MTPSHGRRLPITAKGKENIGDLMQSKDRLRYHAERPFKTYNAHAQGGRLPFNYFRKGLRDILEDLELQLPAEEQVRMLFDKFKGSNQGVNQEEFEALIFRLLCFMRTTQEVAATPKSSKSGEARDRYWRQEFLKKNTQRFADVYDTEKELGKGSFGTVYLVRHRLQKKADNQIIRVCKVISKETAHKAGTPPDKVREEFAVLKKLDHPNVLRVFEDFEDESNFYLIMEPCHGGNLQDLVKRLPAHLTQDPRTYERWVVKVMQHTLSAIAYCHAKGVVHKDLKPENVMMSTPPNTPVEDIHVVVVDWGLAEVFMNPNDRSNVVSGTPPFMAPEVWAGNASKSCDIWSCGVIVFFLLSGRLPYIAYRLEDFPKVLQQTPDWSVMDGATAEGKYFCSRLLQRKETNRPTARECLRDRWFTMMGFADGDRSPRALPSGFDVQDLMSYGQRTTFEKFIARLIATQLDASEQRHVNEAFRTFDSDGDGCLSREELSRGLQSIGASAQKAQQLVAELDVGKTGKISYTEFLAGCVNVKGKPAGEQDRLLWIAWQQFSPDEMGRVKKAAVMDALASRGLTVADMPEEFLLDMGGASGHIMFEDFKVLLGMEQEDRTPRGLAAMKDMVMEANMRLKDTLGAKLLKKFMHKT